MKKFSPFALMTLSLCYLTAPIVAHGDDEEQIIDEVVVTSSYVRPTQIEKHSLVIDGTSVNEGASQSLGELLDDYAGISSSDYGSAVGQPIIRGLSGDRVKILSNGLPVRDVSGIGADHINEVDLSSVRQIEIAKGPSSLLYASGTAGGIINIVDNAIPSSDLTESVLRIGAEAQTVNDGSSGSLSYRGNINGLNLTYSFKDESYGDFDIPSGAVLHSEEEHHDEEDHEDEEEHEEENPSFLENSDFKSRSHKLGVSKVGDWGHLGISYSNIESVFGIPFHGDEHGDDHDEHGDDDHGDDDHGDDDHGDDDHGDEHGDEHEGERIFSSTESKSFDIDGSFNLDLGPINKMSFTLRDSDYSLTEQHAEEAGHGGDHEDEHEDGHEDEHEDEHEGPTTFSNDSRELRVVLNLDNDTVNQSVVFNMVDEDTSLIGEEAFMDPVDASESSFGYYLSRDFTNVQFDFGARIENVEKEGTITEREEHHDDEDEHEEEHEGEVTQHSYSSEMISFAASIGRDFGDAFSITAGGARVNRAPSASELFMNGPHLATGRFEVGDPTLGTETHNNFDIAFNYAANGYAASLTFFNCSVDDFIYLVDETEEEHEDHDDDHGGLIMAEYKQQDADFNGYELELSKSFDLASGVVKLTYARDTVIGEFTDGSDVPRIAPARNIYSVAYGGESIYASLRLKDVEEQTRVATNGTATDGYQMLDFSMRKSFNVAGGPSLNVSIFGNNLLDEIARNHTSFVKNEVPLPGRNYGLKFNFEI